MKKKKKTIYYIDVIADKYDGGDGMYQIKDEQNDETNIKLYTGYYSKKKAKRAFKTIALFSSYASITISIEVSKLQKDGQWNDEKIGSIKLINEEEDRSKIKKKLKKLNW